MIHFTQTFR